MENKVKVAEQKRHISNLATIDSVTAVIKKIPDVKGFVKKSRLCNRNNFNKNDYVPKAALTSQINDLKNQYVPDEIKKVDDKVKKNITDILTAKNSLLHNKSVLDDLEREASYFRGKDYYLNSWLLFKPTFSSFTRGTDSLYIEKWKSVGLDDESELTAVKTTSNNTRKIVISNEIIGIKSSDGDYFKQE